ncbi:telomere-associated 1 [Lecanosticta acicola]|uniref:Telomere-associated 1 n=1 Tax=Lecanosticta acicola TaxID=111012 RepID=A0AAI8W152_9PEZI|nr:telomere-associated 1 [Lecanosticta acicola]
MPPERDAFGSAAHRPTSLDFINLPNPIEPDSHSGSQKHPLNRTPRLDKARLEKASTQDFFNLFHEPSAERPTKRSKPSDSPIELDLPKLPVKNAVKRQRLPPTLSGLHQPPPDAGILPSINVEKPHTPPRRNVEPAATEPDARARAKPAAPVPQAASAETSSSATATATATATGESAKTRQKRTGRNKWSDEETEYLLKGCSRFGVGSWTKILNCSDYEFSNRTALDLKDRFRVVCPDHYKSAKRSKANKNSQDDDSDAENRLPSRTKPSKGPPAERLLPGKLKEMGFSEPFAKTTRRSRHGYTKAEDDALLVGFRKHGASWASIQQDEELGLSTRTATDLRDRLRIKFPEEYAKAGLVPRKGKVAAGSKRSTEGLSDAETGSDGGASQNAAKSAAAVPTPQSTTVMSSNANKEDDSQAKTSGARKPSLFSLDDVFLGNLYGADDDAEPESITLDRGILDWAGADNARTAAAHEPSKNSGIDPLMTLKLPKPISSLPTPAPGFPHSLPTNNNASLPSLSNLLPDQTNSEQLELPSLMQWIDGKNGGISIPTFDELFGQ